MTEYQDHQQKAKAKNIGIITIGTFIFIITICLIVMFLSGCTDPNQQYKVKTKCIDNYVYDVIPNEMQRIQLNEDGSYKKCESGEILK